MKSKIQGLALTYEDLMAIGHGLPFHAQQPWAFSGSYILSHLNDHTSQYGNDDERDDKRPSIKSVDGRSSEVSALMAAGRLEWLLRETRPSLSGRLSEQEVGTLLDCYQGQIYSPEEFGCITSDLCDHLGIELQDYRTSSIAKLVETLLDLTAVQRLTLADALEQTWHRGMKKENMSPKEFLATLGIDLA